jgi:Bacterial TSP3 repeat
MMIKKNYLRLTVIGILMLAFGACEAQDDTLSGSGSGSDGDSDSDSDGDSDGDSDSDSDGDSDGDSDSDSDGDSDGDTDNPANDSDGDGLSNEWEKNNGTDPNKADTDDDGVSDLAEYVAETDPNDPDSNPHLEGNFYFLVPYKGDPDPEQDTLVFSTDIQKADVFILEDTTGSMSMAINQLKRDLKKVIIPEVAAIIPDVWFGVGHYDDYPNGEYGSANDKVFELLQRTTDDEALAQAAVNKLKLGDGVDTPESGVPALWAMATGMGLGTYLPEQKMCEDHEIGYPCFRQGAVPIVLIITDAPFHNGPKNYMPYNNLNPAAPTYDETVIELNNIHAKVIGIKVAPPFNLGGAIVKAHLNRVATDTNTVDQAGDPLVFAANFTGGGLGANIVDAIATLAEQVSMDISADPRDDVSDSVDATVFIDYIEPNTAGGIADPQDSAKICVGGLPTDDISGDGHQDTFVDALPGTPVCFDIHVKSNTTVPPPDKPEVYKAFIDVLGDKNTVLDTREVFFLVPPGSPVV